MRKIMLSLVVILFLISGCGASLKVINSNGSKIEIPIDKSPKDLIGIPEIDYSSGQEFVASANPFLIGGEYRFFSYKNKGATQLTGRISWGCIGIDKDGNIYPGPVILNLSKKNTLERFYFHGKVFSPMREGINIIIYSTRFKYGFDCYGDQWFALDPGKMKFPEYRKELFSKGTPLSELKNPGFFDKEISGWNKLPTKNGFLLSPWGDADQDQVDNNISRYTKTERFKEDFRGTLSFPNPLPGLIANVYDVIHVFRGPTTGMDFDSVNNAGENETGENFASIFYWLENCRRNAKTIIFEEAIK